MNEHTPDPKNLYRKYNIYRANPDGSNGEKIEGPTFTLRPYDPHAQVALLAYARSVRQENHELADDLANMAAVGMFPDGVPEYMQGENAYRMLVSLPDEDVESRRLEEIDRAKEQAKVRRIEVKNDSDETIAIAVLEEMYSYSYWRFLTLNEMKEEVRA